MTNPHKDMILVKLWVTQEELEQLSNLAPWNRSREIIADIIIRANERGDFKK